MWIISIPILFLNSSPYLTIVLSTESVTPASRSASAGRPSLISCIPVRNALILDEKQDLSGLTRKNKINGPDDGGNFNLEKRYKFILGKQGGGYLVLLSGVIRVKEHKHKCINC